MRELLLVLFTLFVFNGLAMAGPKISNYSDYVKDPDFAEGTYKHESGSNGKNRVIISLFDDSNLAEDTQGEKLSKEASLPRELAAGIEQYLSTVAEVFDPNDRKISTLEDAIMNCEMDDKCKTLSEAADYVVLGKINSVVLQDEFINAHEERKLLVGKKELAPAQCQNTATVSATVRIYSFPSAIMSDSINMTGEFSQMVDATSTNCSISRASSIALIQKAGVNAVENVRSELMNSMPPKGYIVERRFYEKGSKKYNIFRLSIGSSMGLKSGDKLDIYTFESYSDDSSGKETMAEIKIASGVVSDMLGANYAWIKVADSKKECKVKKWDFVKVVYHDGFFDKLKHPGNLFDAVLNKGLK